MKVKHFDSMSKLINCMQEINRKKLKMTKKQFALKCNVHDCRKEAEYIWYPSFALRIKTFIKNESPYPFIPRYCKKHTFGRKKAFKELDREGFVQLW